ncbi:MAG: class I SAM-dependent methyltransferase [Chloroflexi bacterium]|nr:class I SAM-dependent methyltransferase [Chloroflexota bacterium]
MSEQSDHQRVAEHLLQLYGGDPFAHVYQASNNHREAHGPDCGVYPSEPQKMRLLNTIVRAAGGRRVLEIGCGLGYSALWLADAVSRDGVVETIDRFPEHIDLARRFAVDAGMDGCIQFHAGEAADILPALSGPYDVIHDDGWFGREPPYFERVVALLRPGGLLVMSNWFLLEQAITGEPSMDWSQFAGRDWAKAVTSYAQKLVARPDLHVSFMLSPAWVALAVKAE